MGEYEIKVDTKKNRMVLKLGGFFSDEELKGIMGEIMGEFDKLKPGFALVSDLARFKPASPKGAAEIMKAQKALKEKEMGRVIRVVGSNVLASKQISRNAKRAGYSAETASSIEEAMQMLDN